jgi:hypothetical protein
MEEDMTDSPLDGVVDLGFALGPFFITAFALLILYFIVLTMMFLEEKKKLDISDDHLSKLLVMTENREGLVFRTILQMVEIGLDSHQFDETDFYHWLDEEVLECSTKKGDSKQRMGVKKYLFNIFSSSRQYLLSEDNRVELTYIDKYFQKRLFHRSVRDLGSFAMSFGLLGTVTGIFAVLFQIDFDSISNIAAIMSQAMVGFSQSLYTTGLGLVTSIPMLFAANKMESEIERIYLKVVLIHDAVKTSIIEAQRLTQVNREDKR